MKTCICKETEGDNQNCPVHYPTGSNLILFLALILFTVCWLGGIVLACGGMQ